MYFLKIKEEKKLSPVGTTTLSWKWKYTKLDFANSDLEWEKASHQ